VLDLYKPTENQVWIIDRDKLNITVEGLQRIEVNPMIKLVQTSRAELKVINL
jgi:hypothetical protein